MGGKYDNHYLQLFSNVKESFKRVVVPICSASSFFFLVKIGFPNHMEQENANPEPKNRFRSEPNYENSSAQFQLQSDLMNIKSLLYNQQLDLLFLKTFDIRFYSINICWYSHLQFLHKQFLLLHTHIERPTFIYLHLTSFLHTLDMYTNQFCSPIDCINIMSFVLISWPNSLFHVCRCVCFFFLFRFLAFIRLQSHKHIL